VKITNPFSEGEFGKECELKIADTICPENKKKFEIFHYHGEQWFGA